jgi:hypothetical protein
VEVSADMVGARTTQQQALAPKQRKLRRKAMKLSGAEAQKVLGRGRSLPAPSLLVDGRMVDCEAEPLGLFHEATDVSWSQRETPHVARPNPRARHLFGVTSDSGSAF